jgi:outer membrane protein OmpA-like peptidoglycan-associated protein
VALGQRAPESTKRGFPWFVALVGLILLALAGLGGWWWWQNEQAWERAKQAEAAKQRIWDGYVAQLRAQPGIVVTESGWQDGKFVIGGLRDPLAVDPEALLRQAGIDPTGVVSHWELYQGLEPAFVLKRLQASLDPPPTVTLTLDGDEIVAQGSAPFTWIERARTVSRMLPAGGPTFDLSRVSDVYQGAIGKLTAAIQSHEIHFNFNEPLPAPGQDVVLDQLAKELKELASLASTMRVAARVALSGHSDETGSDMFNLSLSLGRAEAVRVLMKKRGVDPDILAVRGAGRLEPLQESSSEAARSANRRVSFKVRIEEQR